MTEAQVRRLLENFQGKRIAVVGDLMIDRYYWGSVHRVSPEAPVPVVEVESESIRLGGAANVANNILALGGSPLLCGLIGDDYGGSLFRDLLKGQNLDAGGVIVDPARPTTMKTRVIAAGQHVVRIDNELKQECSSALEAKLVGELRARIGTLDGIIIEDYNKGAVTRGVIRAVIDAANARGIPVTVDPKLNNFFEFTGVTVFKPNRREVEEALGGRLRTPSDIEGAGRRLLETLRARNVLLTRGEEGMSLFESDGTVTHYPTTAEVVQDVSGAGDTVISTLTMALVSGASVRESCVLANCAGGV
ncbi:MAG TPA: D-glycero-beta-D-manno-heptose-7-phosphate kinase, partial [Bacteroidota bacterium]|nr:D-glycero-beta-D-manno-heptose-7-phosphate kinase [Bacteroidota bacterium]